VWVHRSIPSAFDSFVGGGVSSVVAVVAVACVPSLGIAVGVGTVVIIVVGIPPSIVGVVVASQRVLVAIGNVVAAVMVPAVLLVGVGVLVSRIAVAVLDCPNLVLVGASIDHRPPRCTIVIVALFCVTNLVRCTFCTSASVENGHHPHRRSSSS
jgi:hypothetical protein